MKNVLAGLILLALLALFVQPLYAQSRPRRVGNNGGSSQPAPATTPDPPPTLGGVRATSTPQSKSEAPSTAGGAEEVGENEVLRINTTLVTVPVSVMDRNGRYIPDLRKEDFRLFEEDVEQQIAYFASTETPFTVALMIDTSGSTRFRLREIQDAAITFIEKLRPDDRVLVVTFDDNIRVLAEATNDRYTLRDAIHRVRPGEGTRLYDAVDFVINQRFNRIKGRKAIVLFTDGVDTTSRRASYESTVRDAEELDALIYPVQYDTYEDVNAGGGIGWPYPRRRGGIFNWPIPFPMPGPFPVPGGGGGRGSSREDYARADRYLRELADRTGGRINRGDDARGLEYSFSVIAEELRRQYTLGYYPKTTAQAGQRRRIKVRVRQPDLAVRARDSYIFNPNGAAQPEEKQTKPELRKRSLAASTGS